MHLLESKSVPFLLKYLNDHPFDAVDARRVPLDVDVNSHHPPAAYQTIVQPEAPSTNAYWFLSYHSLMHVSVDLIHAYQPHEQPHVVRHVQYAHPSLRAHTMCSHNHHRLRNPRSRSPLPPTHSKTTHGAIWTCHQEQS